MKNLNRKIWTILIGIILLVGVAGTAFIYFPKDKPEMVEIYKDGTLVKSLPLDSEYTEIPVIDEEKENIVVISDEKASMKYANCPDKLCVKQGEVGRSNTPIVCLPNKVVVKLSGGAGDVDAVTK